MQGPSPHELKNLFTYVIETLENLKVPYMVVGGFAAILYGEPRLTIDVDVVIDLKPDQIKRLIAAFPIPDYYISGEEAILDSLVRRYPFNVIQSTTGAKIDLVPLPRDPFTRAAFERRQRLTYDDAKQTATFITAEDIVVAKLIAHKQTGSDKHLRDARGILTVHREELDLETIRRNAWANGVMELLDKLLESL